MTEMIAGAVENGKVKGDREGYGLGDRVILTGVISVKEEMGIANKTLVPLIVGSFHDHSQRDVLPLGEVRVFVRLH